MWFLARAWTTAIHTIYDINVFCGAQPGLLWQNRLQPLTRSSTAALARKTIIALNNITSHKHQHDILGYVGLKPWDPIWSLKAAQPMDIHPHGLQC